MTDIIARLNHLLGSPRNVYFKHFLLLRNLLSFALFAFIFCGEKASLSVAYSARSHGRSQHRAHLTKRFLVSYTELAYRRTIVESEIQPCPPQVEHSFATALSFPPLPLQSPHITFLVLANLTVFPL
jgi:hypothetical protein